MDKDDGGPAFPIKGYCMDASGALCGEVMEAIGMTLRDYFAAKALPAAYAEYSRGLSAKEYPCEPDWRIGVALDAYAMADAMLKARKP